MWLLIGLALFLHPRCFCLASIYTRTYIYLYSLTPIYIPERPYTYVCPAHRRHMLYSCALRSMRIRQYFISSLAVSSMHKVNKYSYQKYDIEVCAILFTMCGMRCVVYTVLIHCCSVISLLQLASHLLYELAILGRLQCAVYALPCSDQLWYVIYATAICACIYAWCSMARSYMHANFFSYSACTNELPA